MHFFDTFERSPRKRVKLPKGLDRRFAIVFVPTAVAVVGVMIVVAHMRVPRSKPGPSPAVDVSAVGVDVRVAAPPEGDDRVRFFRYRPAGGGSVRFFMARGSDGRVHLALDACGGAYARGRGFRQVGGDVLCNHCGTPFPIDAVGGQARTCRPIDVAYRREGEYVVVAARDLDAASRYFPR